MCPLVMFRLLLQWDYRAIKWYLRTKMATPRFWQSKVTEAVFLEALKLRFGQEFQPRNSQVHWATSPQSAQILGRK